MRLVCYQILILLSLWRTGLRFANITCLSHVPCWTLECVTLGSILAEVGGFLRARRRPQVRLPLDEKSNRGTVWRFQCCLLVTKPFLGRIMDRSVMATCKREIVFPP